MRQVIVGLLAALLAAALNSWLITSEGGAIFILYIGIRGVFSFEWLVLGMFMGVAAGCAHRGFQAADARSTAIAGAVAGFFCIAFCHIFQFLILADDSSFGAFLQYLTTYGDRWGKGSWYIGLSLALTAGTGALMASCFAHIQRADNIRAALPRWFPPTIRILIQVATADGYISDSASRKIEELVRAGMAMELTEPPADFEQAVDDVIQEEFRLIGNGRKIKHELKLRCFREQAARDRTAKLAIAVAERDGKIGREAMDLLQSIFDAWNIDEERVRELVEDSFDEYLRQISGLPPRY